MSYHKVLVLFMMSFKGVSVTVAASVVSQVPWQRTGGSTRQGSTRNTREHSVSDPRMDTIGDTRLKSVGQQKHNER